MMRFDDAMAQGSGTFQSNSPATALAQPMLLNNHNGALTPTFMEDAMVSTVRHVANVLCKAWGGTAATLKDLSWRNSNSGTKTAKGKAKSKAESKAGSMAESKAESKATHNMRGRGKMIDQRAMKDKVCKKLHQTQPPTITLMAFGRMRGGEYAVMLFRPGANGLPPDAHKLFYFNPVEDFYTCTPKVRQQTGEARTLKDIWISHVMYEEVKIPTCKRRERPPTYFKRTKHATTS